MNVTQRYNGHLKAEDIDRISQLIDEYLGNQKVEEKNRIRIWLSMEEILLRWRDRFGEDCACALRVGMQFGEPRLWLEVPGEVYDPTTNDGAENGDFSDWSTRMLGNIGLYPIYAYVNGRNQVLLKLKRPQANPVARLLISFLLAVFVGLLGGLLPGSFVDAAVENVIEPVYDAFMGVLSTIAGPMVFLAVAWGIYGIGDVSTLGRIGKKMLMRFLLITLAMVAFSAAVAGVLLGVSLVSDQRAQTSQLFSIFHMLLDIFPDNMVSPFLEGNTMQIILEAIFVGGALLVLGKQTSAISVLVEQLNYVVNFIMELITRLVPWFIFIVMVQMFWTDSFQVITQSWTAVAAFLLIVLLLLGFALMRVAQCNSISPLLLLRKCSETFIVALTTASSTATFGTAMHCCQRKLGIGDYLSNFGLPLGIVFYPPTTAAYFLIISIYMATVYVVEISLAWLLMAVLICSILAIASPPIPGGTLFCYTVLFLQLGIPEEGLVAAMALDVVFDFLTTAINMVMLELELLRQAQGIGLLDRDILKRR